MPDTVIADAYNGAPPVVGEVQNGGAADVHTGNGAADLKQLPTPITYKAVKPHLIIQPPKAAEALAFYKKAFGAEEVEKHYVPKRKAEQEEPLIRHAHIRFGETDIFLADEPEEVPSGLKSTPATLGGGTSFIFHLETSDVDAAFARGVEAGATVRMELADQSWGARYGMLTDPYGYVWGLSTPIPAKEEEAILAEVAPIEAIQAA